MNKFSILAAFGAAMMIAAAQPAAASGVSVLKNGGFESGKFNGWTVAGPYNQITSQPGTCPAGASGGVYCYYAKDGTDSISQKVTSTPGTYLHIDAKANLTAPDFTAIYTDLPAVAILVNGNVVFYTTRQGNGQTIGADVVSTDSDVITFEHIGNTATLLDHISVISNTTP